MKLLILSTHPTIHRWRLLKTFLHILQTCLPGSEINLKRVKLPDNVIVNKGRLNHQWLEDFKAPYRKESTIIGLHLSRVQWRKLKLQSNLNGANPRRANKLQDFYFWSDEKTKRKGFWQFVQVLLHELLHEYFQQKGGTDLTHQWHEENPDIRVRFPIRDIITVLK